MASNLKWRAGFGWGAVFLFAATAAIASVASGILRIAAMATALAVLIFMVYQWRKWNRRGWHQVHFRAMLVYASTSGEEMARAKREGRPFNIINACRELALALMGPTRQANADAMIDALVQERGSYFTHLIETFGAKAFPKLHAEALRSIADKVRQLDLDFGPELVIGNVVENTYGGEEAARYAVAVATRKAH